MKKIRLNYLFSIVLSVCLVLNLMSPSSSFAIKGVSGVKEDPLLSVLTDANVKIVEQENKQRNASSKIVETNIDGVKSTIEITKKTNEIKYIILENDKKNEITIKEDGKVLLNGKAIYLETLDEDLNIVEVKEINAYSNLEITPRKHIENTTSCPNGTTVSQWNSYEGYANQNLLLNNTIKDLSLNALIGIIGFAIGGAMGAILGAVGSSILSGAIRLDPNSNALSCEYWRYNHRNGYEFDKGSRAGSYYHVWFYASANLKNRIGSNTNYAWQIFHY